MEITSSGSLLVFETGNRTLAYQKKRISLKLSNGAIVVRYRSKDIFYITNHEEVTTPSSTSMSDLYSELLALKA